MSYTLTEAKGTRRVSPLLMEAPVCQNKRHAAFKSWTTTDNTTARCELIDVLNHGKTKLQIKNPLHLR